MQVMIGARDSALEMAIDFKATHVIRIGKNTSGRKKFFFIPKEAVLLLKLESANVKVELIERLLGFIETLPANARVFIHCGSGMTRSAAAAIITACAVDRETDPAEHYKRMLIKNPRIVPQKNMMAIADGLLGLDGRLKKYAEIDRNERLRNLRPIEISAPERIIKMEELKIPFLTKLYLRLRFSFAK